MTAPVDVAALATELRALATDVEDAPNGRIWLSSPVDVATLRAAAAQLAALTKPTITLRWKAWCEICKAFTGIPSGPDLWCPQCKQILATFEGDVEPTSDEEVAALVEEADQLGDGHGQKRLAMGLVAIVQRLVRERDDARALITSADEALVVQAENAALKDGIRAYRLAWKRNAVAQMSAWESQHGATLVSQEGEPAPAR